MVKNTATSPGSLYIVATPIGNRDDITLRALKILNSVDVILAEDTRHSSQLLTVLGIQKPLQSLHAHNENEKSQQIIENLEQGLSFALISDAGTPLISDPGFPLVRLAREKGIAVIPVPGACALIAALSAAGMPCDSFSFVGFLPAKAAARKNKLCALRGSEHTVVFYESTHRIIECIEDICQVYGSQYQLALAKELTKAYERFIIAKAAEIKAWLQENSAHCKGEFVVILPPKPAETNQQKEEVLTILLGELPLKQAVKLASLLTKRNKNELYQLALELQDKL
ncbi:MULTISPECIES: 16S rRNA (cytidine(1402)-2'-O)-methyltransferase [unclassified Legionella]|uniref:16S rRNA (cytidine(1402)-2'-O)-methyltransferase n=1 Tax=unclassified Legionella TaxID=2622702 RepID=UPI001056B57F|nr:MULTISPECIES: 16S rRNA (cytidine(1402)-2'-O)-methyltransferase [unclassified Legionella]MDI9818000.1 16S rRNA (cytidine(1402)-2'-O)-methyltransferase [Legionella sp. PL877]